MYYTEKVLLFSTFIIYSLERRVEPPDFERSCNARRGGDCDPYACDGACEARFIRFVEPNSGADRTLKSCQCHEERICQMIAAYTYDGCRSYNQLSNTGQELIRLWTYDPEEKTARANSKNITKYDDERHRILLRGNSRFCCRTQTGRIQPKPDYPQVTLIRGPQKSFYDALTLQPDSSSRPGQTAVILALWILSIFA
ncbi:unnamed protein product, partial [Mesorhabditis spiculigera]